MADPSKPSLGRRPRVGPDGEVSVFVADEQDAVVVDTARWGLLAEAVLRAEGVRGDAELSVLFVGEDEITELNGRFMGADRPTDVLAFPIDGAVVEVAAARGSRGPDRSAADEDAPLLLGDVVVCPAVAQRQAADHAGTFDDELALLVVHGVLHVLGYDHAEPEEAAAMRARERTLLEQHHWEGVAPPGFRQEQP